MKAAIIERQRVKMLKPQLFSEKKCKEKRQSAVEDIFKDVDANNDVAYKEEYSSSEESSSSNSEEEKASSNISNYSHLKNYKKGYVLGNEIVYLPLKINLYLMIVLDRSNLDNW